MPKAHWIRRSLVLAMFAASPAAVHAAEPADAKDAAALALAVSADFLGQALGQSIEKVAPVAVCVERYQIRGTGRLAGAVSAEPLTCPDQIGLRFTLRGQVIGCDRAQLRGVQVHTIDRGAVWVQQDVFVGADGIRRGDARVAVPTQSGLVGIETNKLPLGDALTRGLARAKFQRTPAHNNRIATAASEFTVAQEIDGDVVALLQRTNELFRVAVLDPLRDMEVPTRQLHLASGPAGVSVRLDVGGVKHTPPPLVRSADLGLQVSQLVANRLLQKRLAGQVVMGKDIESALAHAAQAMRLPPISQQGPQTWSITLDRQAPLSFAFEKDQIECVIRGAGYTVGSEIYPAMNIVLRYALVAGPTGVKALRQLPAVVPPDGQPGSAKGLETRQLALILFLARKFSTLLPREIDFSRMPLPPMPVPVPAGRFDQVVARDGWLTISWRLSR